MASIPDEIRRLGGAAKALELRAIGASSSAIRAARIAGIVVRPRKGWYVLPDTPPALKGAVRVGGRATCVTALRELGVWITDNGPLLTHVAVHRAACQLRSVRSPRERQTSIGDAVVHWRDTPRPRAVEGSRLIERPWLALRESLACLDGEDLFATAESVLHLGLIHPHEWMDVCAAATVAQQKILATAGSLSGSGAESLFIFRARRLPITIRQQVQIGPDRVDAVIGDRLVVEINGERYHERHSDLVRDARLIAAGRAVLRFDYRQIMFGWREVEAALVASVVRSDHLW